MSPRQYRLGKRGEVVEQTRERIIDATRELLAREGYPQASVDEVARLADVARATVYYQFGSKKGLIQALVEDIQRLAGAQLLAPSYSSDEALHVLWMLSSFEAFDQLFTGRGLPVEEVARLLGDLAVATLTQGRAGPAGRPR